MASFKACHICYINCELEIEEQSWTHAGVSDIHFEVDDHRTIEVHIVSARRGGAGRT